MEHGRSINWLASHHLELFPAKDAAAVLGLAIFIPVIRWALEPMLFMPVARKLLGARQSGPLKFGKSKKLCESQWKFLYYSGLTILGLVATHSQPWLLDTKQLWEGWPNQVMTTPMRLLYMAELSYYLATIIMLAVWEVPRKDYFVMMMHHFSTVALIIFTYKYNYARAGCVVMLLHDINDVLMETAKILNYANYETGSTLVFVAFMASWVALRLVLFPAYIINSTLFEVQDALGFKPPFHTLLNCLLVFMYMIHIYWFMLIMRVAYKKLTTGHLKDVRESPHDE